MGATEHNAADRVGVGAISHGAACVADVPCGYDELSNLR